MDDGFTLPPEQVTEDGDMTRLVLQHCVMPAYQFIIQVAPDQTSVIHLTLQILLYLILCLVFISYIPATFLTLARKLLWCSIYEDGLLPLVRN